MSMRGLRTRAGRHGVLMLSRMCVKSRTYAGTARHGPSVPRWRRIGSGADIGGEADRSCGGADRGVDDRQAGVIDSAAVLVVDDRAEPGQELSTVGWR